MDRGPAGRHGAGAGRLRTQGSARTAADRIAGSGRGGASQCRSRAGAKTQPVRSEPRSGADRPQGQSDHSFSIRFWAIEPVMNYFHYRNGVLHAEAVNLIHLADAIGTPFYCYSTATLERHYRVFSEAVAGEKAVVCYAMKANFNQSCCARWRNSAPAPTWVGRRIEVRDARRHSAAEDFVLRRRQDRSRTARGAGRRHSVHQRRIRTESTALAACHRDREDGADLGAGQSRRRRRHPCQDRHRQVREQVGDRCPRARAVDARAAQLPGSR